MFLTPLITSAALALFNGLYLHHLGASQSLRDSGLPADILATADFTNDLIHYVQALHSPQLQDFVAPADTYGLDEDYAIVTIGHIDENYHDAMSLETPVDFSDCEPLFDKLWYHRPDDQPPNDEDEPKLKAVIEEFVHGTASETVERCIKSMGIAVQQHVYLRKLHAATSLWVQNIEKTDLPDQHVDIRDQRSYKLTAGVTYLSVMLEAWTHETAGLREFLINLREMLWEERARVARDAAPRTGLFVTFKKAMIMLVIEVAVFVEGRT